MQMLELVHSVCLEADNKYFSRRRVLSSKLLVLLIFKLILSKNKQGYGSIISDFWEECRVRKIALPSNKPVTASSFCESRTKLNSQVFVELNERFVNVLSEKSEEDVSKWNGYKPFAVDGSNLNLPRELISSGYSLPRSDAYYPQGKLSCLYHLKLGVAYSFLLSSNKNERKLAESHFPSLGPKDVVVYDRGYFAYGLMKRHNDNGLNYVMRLSDETFFKEIKDFIESTKTDSVVTINPISRRRKKIRLNYPDLESQDII